MTATPAPHGSEPSIRALIAEDEAVSRAMLEAMASKVGLDPILALDGEAAWRALEELDAPMLMLFDWTMPGMDGIELLKRVRGREWRVEPYVIMVTGRTDADDLVAGLEAGANDYVTKPIDRAELRARIQVGITSLELRLELARQLEELRHALEHVKTLQGIIPICSYCHHIRDDQRAWHRLESYVSSNTDAQFSHGICPACMRKHFPDFVDDEA